MAQTRTLCSYPRVERALLLGGGPNFLPVPYPWRNTALPSITGGMLWVAVFALVCMAEVGLALLGVVGYLLYATVRHLVDSVAARVAPRRRKPEPVAEPPEPVPHT